MNQYIDFSSEGYSLNVNGEYKKYKYSPFFPYDINKVSNIITKSSSYISTIATPSTGMTTASTGYDGIIYNNCTFDNRNLELKDSLFKSLSSHFIKNGFIYWKIDKYKYLLLKVYEKHKNLYNNSLLSKFKIYHSYGHILNIYNSIENKGLSSPITFFLNLIHEDKEKEYFLNDLLKFSTIKTLYILESIINNLFTQNSNIVIDTNNIYSFINKHGIEDIYNNKLPNLFDTYTGIISDIPKSLNKFPLNISCKIPTLACYPKTEFQWSLTNVIMENRKKEINLKDIKETTHILNPYINASDKAVEIYKQYKNTVNNHHIFTFGINYVDSNYPYSKYDISDMLTFIEDGEILYNKYNNKIIKSNGKILKMNKVKGSFLKQIKNSIFNHNLERKISIEDKLAMLTGGSDEPMFIDIKLSEKLESLRIKTKSELIILGKMLNHCIGGKTESKNLFFRNDSVCAEVDIKTKSIIQCLDKNNKRNEKTEFFENQLIIEFQKIDIFLNLDKPSPRIKNPKVIKEIKEYYGNDIVDDEGYLTIRNAAENIERKKTEENENIFLGNGGNAINDINNGLNIIGNQNENIDQNGGVDMILIGERNNNPFSIANNYAMGVDIGSYNSSTLMTNSEIEKNVIIHELNILNDGNPIETVNISEIYPNYHNSSILKIG